MPRYDYRCTSCGNTFEVSHGMREHPDIACPSCGGAAQRIFDVSGIVLKGSGFYNTDQRGKKGITPATGGKDPEAHSSDAAEKSDAGKHAQASSEGTGSQAAASEGAGSSKTGKQATSTVSE